MSESEIISFKGTRHGILMSIAEDEPFGKVMEVLKIKLDENKSFFDGSNISLDLGWREMDDYDLDELLYVIKLNSLNLLGIISTSLTTRKLSESRGLKVIIGRLGLADHHGRKKNGSNGKNAPVQAAGSASPTREIKAPGSADETLLIRKTIRSGQSIDHPGNLVIMGDVNPGAEVKAGGDILIFGALRGIAHAGRNSGYEIPSVSALKFEPTQIRIKDKIESSFDRKVTKSKQAVTAVLNEGKIEYHLYRQ